jgi:beta-lactamase superfamily II metal-dependent hydrolase
VDAGNYSRGRNEVVPYLREIGIDRLTYIVATHYDADHIGGMDEVLEEIPLQEAAFDHGEYVRSDTTETFREYLQAVEGNRITMASGDGELLDLGPNIAVRCLSSGADELTFESENDRSIVLVINYESFDYYLGGDISGVSNSSHTDVETMIAEDVGKIEAMKVNHHGSRYSSNEYFLEKLNPLVAIISCGANSYGHPHENVIARLNAIDCDIFQTEGEDGNTIDGDILLSSSGTEFSVNSVSGTFEYECHPEETLLVN